MSKVIITNRTRGQELLWRRVKKRKTLDDICHAMELEIPASEWDKVRKHDRLQARLENPLITDSGGRRLVATVMVDEITATVEPTARMLTVIGRSPARDIIDSTWTDAFWPTDGAPMTFADAAREICAKFDIRCNWFPADQPDPTSPIGFFAWQNESPWPRLQTEAGSQGFLLTSNEAGGMYIWKPSGTARSEGFRVTEGKNVKSIEWRQNGAEQFRKYVVTGHFDEAIVFDDTCNTNRVLTIDLAETGICDEKLRRRAETEMRRRRENRTTVTVSGWGLSGAQLRELGDTARREVFWSPNFLIPVRMPSLNLSQNLLIAEVEHEADARSMRTSITLVNREAYL